MTFKLHVLKIPEINTRLEYSLTMCFRDFCCPLHETGGGEAIHPAEETVRTLGPTPLSEPMGLHRSRTGDTVPCGVNSQDEPV